MPPSPVAICPDSRAPKETLFKALGHPRTQNLVRCDGKPLEESFPKHMVQAAEWDNWMDEDNEDIRIIDLGQSFLQGAEPKKLAQAGDLRAPETIFAENFDYGVDL